jgi:hypothetical protein
LIDGQATGAPLGHAVCQVKGAQAIFAQQLDAFLAIRRYGPRQ